MTDPSPLERLRRELALAVGENAVFDGWTKAAVDSAAKQLGIDPTQARLAMPKGQAAMIDLYIQEVDRALEAWATPKRHGEAQDPREDPDPGLAPAGDHGAGARGGATGAGDPRHAAESSARRCASLAHAPT